MNNWTKVMVALVCAAALCRGATAAAELDESAMSRLFNEARELAYQNDMRQALDALQRITRAEPPFSRLGEVHMEMGRIYQSLGDSDAAVAAYLMSAETAAHSGSAAQALFQAGNLLAGAERWERAAAVFDQLIERHPGSHYAAESVFLLARSLERSGRAGQAFELLESRYEAAVDPNPRRRLAEALIELCVRQRAFIRAVEFQRRRVEADPGDPNLVYQLAELYAKTGDYPEALGILKPELEAAPGNSTLLRKVYGVYDEAGRVGDWIAELRGRLARAPRRHDFEWLAQIMVWERDGLGALRVWEQALDVFPSDVEFLARAGEAYMEHRWISRALETLDRGLAVAPENRNLLRLRGRAHALDGDAQAAQRDWERAVGFDPDHSGSYRALAQLFFDNGLYDQALAVYLEARSRFKAREGGLFAREIAGVYEARLEYEPALDMYVAELRERPASSGWVNSRVAALVSEPDVLDYALAALPERVGESEADVLLVKLRAELMLGAGMISDGLEALAAVSRALNDRGGLLFHEAQRLKGRGRTQEAVQAADICLDRFRDHYYTPKALLLRAELRAEMGRLQAAAGDLERLAADHPQAAEAPEALYRLGLIRYEQDRLDEAVRVLERLAAVHGLSLWSDPARMLLARIDLARGRPEAVEQRLAAMSATARHGAAAAYLMAEAALMAGDVDAALAHYGSAYETDPGAEIANDALARIMIILKLRNAAGGVDALVQIESAVRTRRFGRALRVLDEYEARAPEPDVKAYLSFRRGEILALAGRAEEAAAAYEAAAEEYHAGFFAPWALINAAELHGAAGRYELAFDAYKRVVDRHRDSIFLERARQGMERLREHLAPSP